MNSTSYQPPIDKLLTLGLSLRLNMGKQEYDYIVELGLSSQHIPDLIRMGCDRALLNADSGSLDVWAAIHAWRALGQLGSEVLVSESAIAEFTANIAPLIQLFHELEDNDLVSEELPKVFSKIGVAAISPLACYLADDSHPLFSRVNAINSLEEIAKQNENLRDNCVLALTRQLENYQESPPELNGFIVAALINLEAKNSASVIKLAFAVNQVAEDIVGSWEEVKQSLGIGSDDELQELQVEVVEFTTPISVVDNPDIEAQESMTLNDAIFLREKFAIANNSNDSNNYSIGINAAEKVSVEMQEVTELGTEISVENSEEADIVENNLLITEEVMEETISDIDVIPEAKIAVEEMQVGVNVADDVVEGISNLPTQNEIDKTSTEIREEANSVAAKLVESNDKEEIRGFGKVGSIKDKENDKNKSKQKKKKRNFVDL